MAGVKNEEKISDQSATVDGGADINASVETGATDSSNGDVGNENGSTTTAGDDTDVHQQLTAEDAEADGQSHLLNGGDNDNDDSEEKQNEMLDPAITGDSSSMATAVAVAAAAAAAVAAANSPDANGNGSLSPKRGRKTKKAKKELDLDLDQHQHQHHHHAQHPHIQIEDQQILDPADAEALAASALSQSPLDTLSLAATSAAAETKSRGARAGNGKASGKGGRGANKKAELEYMNTASGIIDENISPELAGAGGVGVGGVDGGHHDGHHHHGHDETTHPDLVAKSEQQLLEQAISAAVIAGNNAGHNMGGHGMQLLPSNFQTAFGENHVAAAQLASANELDSGPMSIASLTNPTPQGGLASANGANLAASSRKKRQCSTCLGWFSNLATHRSTHLADNSRPHSCEVCGRGFARPNDLFRHQKSHRDDAAFRCPLFVKATLYQNAYGNLEPACHQNGGFSRCDTYKNHLKAMHFEYPAGTKKRDRPGMSGKCKGCGLEFENADRWINEHIETRECEDIKKLDALRNKFDDPSIEAAAVAAAAAAAAVSDDADKALVDATRNAAVQAQHHSPSHAIHNDHSGVNVSAPGPILPPSSSAGLSETTA
ncbi:Stp3p [Sugiyamaella lignohabitans]|uniref:Stp3p n=1 Tax=Sugiyamaella lignohabitans TaxID=796027 RepID=A0A167DCA6_9ASCO|nr:Stp3p [Sugiyamaella lignohabitans]ANB12752.1 Stp3p [Sugiyamaella lignohabitans]